MAPCDWQGNLKNADNGAGVGGQVGVVSVDSLHGGEVGLYFIRYKHFLECDHNTPSDSPSRQAAASPASSAVLLLGLPSVTHCLPS